MTRKIKIIVAIAALLIPALVWANDAPHANYFGYGIQCGNCHWTSSATQPPWSTIAWTTVGNMPSAADDTINNRRCWVCHQGGTAPDAKTHSNSTTNSTKWSVQGGWTTECVTCHNPHQQRQTRAYGSASYVVTGSAPVAVGTYQSGTNTTPITLSAPLTSNYYGYYILPDITYPIYYEITSDTTNTNLVQVKGQVNTAYVKTGVFAIVFARNVNDVVSYINPGNAAVGGTVKLFNPAGANGPADASTVSTSVCVVCHTLTSHYNSTGSGDLTHNAGLDCTTCHKHEQGFKGGGCDVCHGYPPIENVANAASTNGKNGLIDKDKAGAAATSGSTIAGMHNTHINTEKYVCLNCHTGGMIAGASAGDNKINIGFAIGAGAATTLSGNYDGQVAVNSGSFPYLGTSPTTVSATGSTQCSNLYCHSNVQGANGVGAPTSYATPKWDGSVTVQCGSCHDADGVQGNLTTMATGSHTKHANASTGYGRPCSTCHTNPGAAGHVDYSIEVNIDATYGGTYSGSSTPGSGYGSCSNVYCHSDGKATPTTVASVTWGSAATTCTSCHGSANGVTGGAGTALSTGHGAHTNNGAITTTPNYNYGCADCHSSVAGSNTTIIDKSLHVNKLRNVSVNASHGGTGTSYDSVSKSCSNIYCHGSKSPAWGTDLSSYDNCTICHGAKTVGADGSTIATAPEKVAPGGAGTDTNGDSAPSDPQVGQHQAHLTGVAGTVTYSTKIACNQCHTVPANVTDAGHNDHALPAIVQPNLATTLPDGLGSNKGAQAWTYTTGTCTTVYCHGNGLNNTSNAANKTPVWNDITYLNGTASHDCAQCHGYPPATASNTPAGTHPAATPTQCTSCHSHVNAAGDGFTDPSKHIDGLVEAAGCDGCHGNPPTTATYGGTTGLVGAALNSGDTGATNPLTPGAHDKHVNALTGRGMTCDACHNGSSMPTLDKKIQMGFNVNSTTAPGWGAAGVTTGTFTGYSALSNGFSFASGNAGTTVNTAANTNNQCSNLYCHGSTLTGGSNTSPAYVTATTGQCGTCHGATAAAAPTAGSHTKHASSGGYGFTCATCHGAMPANEASHVDGSVAWSISTTDQRTNGGTYKGTASGATGGLAPSGTYGSCTSLYCHSNGNPVGGTIAYQTPTWGNSASGACGTCHGVLNTSAPASASHAKHVGSAAGYQFSCSKCHSGTVTATANSTVQPSISSTTLHVNNVKDVAFDSFNGSASAYTPGAACTNLYCHSNGTGATGQTGDVRALGAPATAPLWSGSTINCGSCHGADATGRPAYTNGSPKANSHQLAKHSSLTCDKCHNATTTTGNTITNPANHVNKVYDVVAQGTSPYTFTYSYASTGGSCSTTYCHGAASPAWGTTGSLTCASCHSSMGGGGTVAYTGKHQKHADTAGYDFSCEMCHSQNNGTVHVNGEVAANTQSAQVFFNNTGTGAFTTGLTYNGSASTYKARGLYTNPYNAESAVTPSYTSTGTTTADPNGSLHYRDAGTCSNVWCHSNANPKSGTNSYSTPAWNLTMTCGSCHRTADTAANMALAGTPDLMSGPHIKHVATDGYGVKINCSTCHNATTTDGVTIASKTSHVNGVKDIAFDSFNTGGTYNGTNCSNIYCHSNGTGATGQSGDTRALGAPNTAPTWATGTITCGSCHDGTATGPSYTNGTPKANSHNKHVVVNGLACVTCHSATVDASNNIISPTNHNNKVYDVAGAKITSYTYNSTGGTCATACHAASTPQWGTTSTGCNFCHLALPTSGSHAFHVTTAATAYGQTTVSTTGGVYNFGCGNCHPKDPAMHGNGTVDIVLNDGVAGDTLKVLNSPSANMTKTGTGGTDVCNLTYCHSNGTKSGAAIVAGSSPASGWGNTYSGDSCAMCHGNSPTTGSHQNHVMAGIHYDNIYTGGTGLAAMGNTATGAHGNNATATTISCNICHYGTVTTDSNDQNLNANANCGSCHNGTAVPLKGNVVIDAASNLHLNGVINVVLQTGTVLSKAQLRDTASGGTSPVGWTRNNGYKSATLASGDSATINGTDWSSASKTCTTACHLNQASPTWGTPTTCNSCHTTLPN